MREAAFHRQNAEKWKQFEALLRERELVDPDQLADLYVEITEDLAYARTFYPESRTTRYLNALAVELHGAIYRKRREQTSRFITFWKTELPILFAEHRRELGYSAAIFLLASLIGLVSAALNPDFIRLILGDSYVNLTLDNIQRGDPMAIYGSRGELDSFLLITLNNVLVSFRAFAMGALLSLGTAWVLFHNGVMLGAFQYLFHEHGVLFTSLVTIWVHGTLEISAVIVAGAAGLVLGNSLLFPGTYTRAQSFRRGALDGMRMVIGLVPVFVLAGFLESFVTRHADVNPALGITIIALSAVVIVWYVVVYPISVQRRLRSEASDILREPLAVAHPSQEQPT